jgi:hypothetical protein
MADIQVKNTGKIPVTNITVYCNGRDHIIKTIFLGYNNFIE